MFSVFDQLMCSTLGKASSGIPTFPWWHTVFVSAGDSWAFLCLVWHGHWCHSCSTNVLTVMFIRSYCEASDITGRHHMRHNFTTNSMVLTLSILSSRMFSNIVMGLFCRYIYLNWDPKLFSYCSLSVAKRKINL